MSPPVWDKSNDVQSVSKEEAIMVDQSEETRHSRRAFLGQIAAGTAVVSGLGVLDQRVSHAATVLRKPQTVTLKLAMYAEPSRTPIQKAMIAAFQRKYPNIRLSVETSDFNTFYTKLNTNIAAGTVPDVFMMSGAYFYNATSRGVLKDLGPYIKASGLNLARDYFTEPANQV